ncbi:MAG TPA: histidine-type phosphatase [Trebonia sp.]|nr:histidine-type phosphatase [Trebonia sp.]
MKLRSWPTGAITLTAAAALCGSLAMPAHAAVGNGNQGVNVGGIPRIALTTKAPYLPEGNPHAYPQPPRGFQPVFTENVQRHGSRDLTSSDDGDALLALWQAAQANNALTTLGKGLGPEITQLLAANAAVGYGNLDQDGKQELTGIAQRMVQRLPSLFASAAKSAAAGSTAPEIAVVAASQQRTVDSGTAFVAGLEKAVPGLTPVVGAATTDNNLLYFHKAAVNQDYQNYLASDPRLQAAEAAATDSPTSHAQATTMLERSFTPAFVKQLAAGTYSAEFANEVDAASALYSLWQVTKDMADEGNWTMDRYLTTQQESWFGYLDDVTSFYENGPAFSGDDITDKMAGVLLNDMFAQVQAKVNGTSNLIADLRFTHAEEIFPLATLLGLPGSTKQLPAGTEYTYADNSFRGANVAPMAANIQWDVFKNGSTYLVRMLYNEQPTAFKPSCAPTAKGSLFYNLNELETCYGYTAG